MKRMISVCSVFAVSCVSPALYAAQQQAPAKKNPVVLMKTAKGDIKIELYEEKAPKTVKNFLRYVSQGFYQGTIFHRVIKGFMIQGGGFDIHLKEKSTEPPIEIESKNGLKNVRGSIAMARTNNPNSATSQFFINHADNDFLNYTSQDSPGYAVFGMVISGMEVVDKIADLKVGQAGYMRDVPVNKNDALINSVTIVK